MSAPLIQNYAELDGVEVLQVGALPERGIAFTKSDLEEIARNTNQLILEGLHNPPGKLGHDDTQAFAQESGLPASGWVQRLRVVGDKLMADFVDVPKVLMRAFKEKLYRKVSSEVYFGFSHPKTHDKMGKVLRAVAFLGADIPQVKGLADFFSESQPYSLTQLDAHGKKYRAMTEVNISISIPEEAEAPEPAPEAVAVPNNPETPLLPAPGPMVAEGLAGRELELYRQAEKAASMLKDKGEPEFAQDGPGLEPLLRFVGRVGAAFCASSPEFRGNSDNPEELCAFLEARARERGFIIAPQPKEDENMDKVKELEAHLAEAQSKAATSEQEAQALKEQVAKLNEVLAAQKKAEADKKVAEFVEKNKAVITPAIEPNFRALCEAIGEGEVTVKLAEGKEQKCSKLDAVLQFAEAMANAKVVNMSEVAPGSKPQEKPAVKTPAGANYRVELHEEATRLQMENKSLSYWQAITQAIKAKPELAA